MEYLKIKKVENIFDSLVEKSINKYSIRVTSKEIVDIVYKMEDDELFNFFIHDCYDIFIPLWYMCNTDYQNLIEREILPRLSKYMRVNTKSVLSPEYDVVNELSKYINDVIATLYREPFNIIEKLYNNNSDLIGVLKQTLNDANFIAYDGGNEIITTETEDINYDALMKLPNINVIVDKLNDIPGMTRLTVLIYLLFMTKDRTVKQIILYNIKNFKINREAEMNKQIVPVTESSIGLLLADAIYVNSINENKIISESLIEELTEALGVYDGNELFVSESITEELYSKVLECEDIATNYKFNLNHKFISIKEGLINHCSSIERDDKKMIYKLFNEAGEITGLMTMLNSGEFRYYNDKLVKESKYEYEVLDSISVNRTYYTTEGVIGDGLKKAGRTVRTVNKKVSESIDKVVNALVKEIKSIFVGDTREEIITDALPKMSRLLKMALPNLLLIGVNPVLGVLSAATTYALHDSAKKKERNKILIELKNELEIVNEKIDDAKSKGDNKQKYALIRIRQQLERDIERIRYKYNRDV